MLYHLIILVGGWRNVFKGMIEGLPLIGVIAMIYALAMLAPLD